MDDAETIPDEQPDTVVVEDEEEVVVEDEVKEEVVVEDEEEVVVEDEVKEWKSPFSEEERGLLHTSYNELVQIYLEENSITDHSKYSLFDEGRDIQIYEWGYSIPKPDGKELLKLTEKAERHREKKKFQRITTKSCIQCLSNDQREFLSPEDGVLIFNKDVNKLQVYCGNQWHS